MTEVIDHGHSFISHPSTMVPTYGAGREHKGRRVLIPDKSGLKGQSRSSFYPAIAGSLPRQGLSIWPDFSFSRNQAKLFISVNSGNSSDHKERAREIKEFLISEYAIIFTN